MSIDLCPEQKQLHDFVTGRLPETSLELIAEHLEACGVCDRSVATMEPESDSFVEELKCPAGDGSFVDEPEFRQVVQRVQAFECDTEHTPTSTTSNHQMLGQYMLVERLGTGGMGTVHKALHTKLEKFVAVKILRTKRTLDDHAIARFEREMKAVGKLNHENIVQASDAGEANGKQFLVMEYIEGAEFSELIRQHNRLSIADACELVRQAAVGLQHAFDHGLVHRDIKPSNLMLAEDGCVKVLDLGLARYADERLIATDYQSDDTFEGNGLTHVGQIMGTAEYIAPEQASNSHDVDIRADVYGLGCTLYALLAGMPPFPRMEFASTKKLVHAHQMSDRPSLRDARDSVPTETARIVNKMLAIDPDDRFSSPAEVATALSPFTAGANLAALLTPEQPAKSNHNPTRDRGRFVPWAITLTVLSLVAVVALGVILSLKTPQGTVEIKTGDKNVEISVKQGGEEVEIINAESGWTIRLKEGTYDVDLKGGKDKFKLEHQSITVTRDGKVTVRVLLNDTPPKKAGPVHQNLPEKHAKRRSYMLEFSGRRTHVVIPKLQYDGSHPITFEATVMSLHRGSIIANFSGAGLGLDVADGYVSFHVNDGRTTDNGYVRVKSSISVGRDKPVHIAGVLDGNKLRLFVDGKVQGSETIGKFNKSEFPFMIGADPGGQGEPTQFLNGFIDEVRVSKTARYDKDFAPPSQFEADKRTLLLYRFDEGEEDVAHDASDNALHARIHGAKWVPTKTPSGIVDSEPVDDDTPTPTPREVEGNEDSALWNEFGVTPAPVSPLTAKVLEWIGLHLRPIKREGFRGKNVFAKYAGGLAVTFVRTHGPAEKAGIHDVDIVVTLRGLGVVSLKELDSAIQDAVRNDAVSLQFEVLRGGETVDVNVPIVLRELALDGERIKRLELLAEQRKARPRTQDHPQPAGVQPTQPRASAQVEGTKIRCEVGSLDLEEMRVRSIAPDGKQVRRGDLLVEFSGDSIARTVSEQKIKLSIAESRLLQSRLDRDRIVTAAEGKQAEAKTVVSAAEVALAAYLDGDRAVDVKALEAAVKIAELTLKRAERPRAVAGQEKIEQVDQAEVEKAEIALDVAKLRLDVFNRFSVPKMTQALETELASARRSQEANRIDNEAQINRAEATIKARQATVEAERIRGERLVQNLKLCRVTAPHDGVVYHLRNVPAVKEGSLVRKGQVILILRGVAKESR